MTPDDAKATEIERWADLIATYVTADDESFRDSLQRFAQAYQALLKAVSRGDARLAFDRDGRPGAIEAVRAALPAIEQDLFSAVLEDYECELAAVEEALFQVIRAYGRRSGQNG